MRIVNSNYKTQFSSSSVLTIEELHACIKKSTLYINRPKMLKIRKNGVTMLIFNTFNVRLMGSGNYHKQIFANLLAKIPDARQLTSIKLISHTVIHQLEYQVNLHKLDPLKFEVLMEIFPAATYKHNKPIHVNIFGSGKVVLTGVVKIKDAKVLLKQLDIDLENGECVYNRVSTNEIKINK